MKKKLLICFALMLNICVFASKPDFKSMKDWEVIQNNTSGIQQIEPFRFENHKMIIASQASGYIRTKKIYKNFVFQVEWRWINAKGNSGVLTHIQTPDKVWPVCYQAQLKADAAGDLICMNGLKAIECVDTVKFTVPKILVSNEKNLGEWNVMKIISKNNSLKVYVNGVLQNQISGLTAEKGYIGFQAEGQSMEFRNLHIR